MASAQNGRVRQALEKRAARILARCGYHLSPLSAEDRSYLGRFADDGMPLTQEAKSYLSSRNPRLNELCAAYRNLHLPAAKRSRWSSHRTSQWIDLHGFRGETMFVWHYRELPQVTALKYFAFGEYVRSRDHRALIAKLGEDGAFGCWTFDFGDRGRYSRDLLDSINEICFLDRQLEVFKYASLRVLDIGAGYGRLAHRMVQALPELGDYCCVDAVPEATFLSEYYLNFRGVSPPARVVPLDRATDELEPGRFDLAVNIHSFSECPYEAVEWWVQLLRRLRVPRLLLVPNDGERLLSFEFDGSRRDFGPLLADAGFRLVASEPTLADPAIRSLLHVDDHFLLFELAG